MGQLAGQASLFEKMLPFLDDAQQWLFLNIVPEDLLRSLPPDSQIVKSACMVIAYRAWWFAIPAVDVVVSANGVGVVETQTLRPASAAKISAMIASARKMYSSSLNTLISFLEQNDGWLNSGVANFFKSSFLRFSDCYALAPCSPLSQDKDSDIFEIFRDLVSRAQFLESVIEQQWISSQLAAELRKEKFLSERGESRGPVISLIRQAVINSFICRPHDKSGVDFSALSASDTPLFSSRALTQLEMAVDIIRQSPDDFPTWHSSDVAKAFDVKSFGNSKSSSAYFL